ncbi:MAG: hypothetical protein IT429_18705, partial [Gemmataceae bacterium]|nr:hypothetical protein [Gemmataceae bacterium]
LGGVGLGAWPSVYPRYATFDDGLFSNQAHSDWLQWAAEGGVPFAVLLAAFAACLLLPAVRSIWGLGLFAVFGNCLIDYPLQKPAVAAVFFTLAGALWAGRASRARGKTPGSRAAAAGGF